jgi:hypothetical protein
MLTVTSPVTGNSVRVVDEYFTNVLGGSIGLTNFFHVGLSIPTVYFEQGNHFATGADFEVASFGDIGLEMKATLLKDSKIRPGIALVSVTTFPSGSTEKFTGYSNITEEGKLVIDKRLGPVYLALNGGYRMVPRTQVADLDVNDLLTYGAGFTWSLPIGRLDLMAEVDGAMVAGNRQERTSPLEWLAGLRQKPVEGMSIDFAAGTGIGSGVGGGDFRIIAGFTFRSVPPEVAGGEALLSETILFQKDRPKIDRKSQPALDRIVDLMKKDEKSEIELRGDPELTAVIAHALQDRGISRWRITENPPEASEAKTRSVEIRVVRKSDS